MGWTCTACTFSNSNDEVSRCEICQTQRKKTMTNTKTTQRTLFGKSVLELEPTTRESRKRKVAGAGAPPSDIIVIDKDNNNNKPVGPLKKNRKQKVNSLNPNAVASSFHKFSHKVRNLKFHPVSKDEIQNTLTTIFGLKSLRNLQPQVVEHAMERKSLLVVMATGGGKSLCYQLPACLLGGMTIVISPLIALMMDQVQALLAKRIPAACVCSAQPESQNKAILQQVADGKNNPPVLLYITPESIQTNRMRTLLKQLYKQDRLAFFAVDEAHCLSRYVPYNT